MADISSVRPGVGIGELKFGASIEEAEAYFGAPDDRDESKLGDDTTVRLLWGDDLACWFDSDDDFRLGSIQVEHSDAVLSGHRLIGHRRADVFELLVPLFGEPELEDMSVIERPDYWLANFDSLSLNLWFENGLLASIQWGYLFDHSGDNPVWPT